MPDGAASSLSDRMPIKNPEQLINAAGGFWPGTMDPAANYVISEPIFNVYDTLIFYDGESSDQFVPWLATEVPSVENGLIRDDGRTYVFPIREGVTFHAGPVLGPDGQPIPGSGTLSPEDVAYSFQRGMLAEPPGGPQFIFLSSLLGTSTLLEFARQMEEQGGGKKATEVATKDDVSQATSDGVCQAVKDAVQVDGQQVVFHLPVPYAPFLQTLLGTWGGILDKEWVAAEIPGDSGYGKPGKKAGWNGDCSTWRDYYGRKWEDSELVRSSNGTGPYKLTQLVPEAGWTLDRNDAFWKGPARLKQIINTVVPDFTTRLLMFQNGDADTFDVWDTNVDQVQPLVSQGRLREILNRPGREMWFARLNQKIDPVRNGFIGSGKLDGEGIPPDFFSDIDVRKGFAYLFDLETFVRERLNGNAVPPTGPLPSNLFGFDPEWKAYPYDLDKAAEHLKKAFGGKLWERGFYMVSLGEPALVLPLQRDLAAINPKFRISVQNQAVNSFANTAQDLEPLTFGSWYEDYHDADNWVYSFLGSTGFLASTSDFDPAVQKILDDLIVKARREQDPTKRASIYSRIGQIAHENALVIFTAELRPPFYEPERVTERLIGVVGA